MGLQIESGHERTLAKWPTRRLEPLCGVRLRAFLGVAEFIEVALYIHIGTVQRVPPLPAGCRIDTDCLKGGEQVEDRAREVRLFERGQLGTTCDCVAVLIVAVNGILQLLQPDCASLAVPPSGIRAEIRLMS